MNIIVGVHEVIYNLEILAAFDNNSRRKGISLAQVGTAPLRRLHDEETASIPQVRYNTL